MAISHEQAVAAAQAGQLLGATEMAALWRISVSRFYRLHREGAFDAFKVHPAIGPKCFSGFAVFRYLQGERLLQPTFGRKKAS